MSDVGIYESKKHYATHKIFDEGDPVDKTKFSGIELKKAQVPKEMKTFLAEIYDGVISKDWKEEGVSYVRLQFTDILGTIKAVEISVVQLERSRDDGHVWDVCLGGHDRHLGGRRPGAEGCVDSRF